MGNLWRVITKFFKRRAHERHAVPEGTFIVVAGMEGQKVQVIDISKGGLAFVYAGTKDELAESGVLNLLTDSPHLDNVQYEAVTNTPTELGYRRVGVQFKWMGVLQKIDLDNFIREARLLRYGKIGQMTPDESRS